MCHYNYNYLIYIRIDSRGPCGFSPHDKVIAVVERAVCGDVLYPVRFIC